MDLAGELARAAALLAIALVLHRLLPDWRASSLQCAATVLMAAGGLAAVAVMCWRRRRRPRP